MQQRWRARWNEDGEPREFVFESIKSLMIARIDFQLKFAYAFIGRTAPEQYELEEVTDARTYYPPSSHLRSQRSRS